MAKCDFDKDNKLSQDEAIKCAENQKYFEIADAIREVKWEEPVDVKGLKKKIRQVTKKLREKMKEGGGPPSPEEVMEKCDTDKDGFVKKDEALTCAEKHGAP